MRGSAWAVAGAAGALWIGSVGWPAAAMIITADAPGGAAFITTTAAPLRLLVLSSAWGLAIAAASALLGWPAGRILGAALGRGRFAPLAAACLLPICLPAYMVFYAWWQAWPPDSDVYQWAVEHGRVPLLREATLLASLVCWSWPVVAWSVAASAAGASATTGEMLRLDGAGPLRRLGAALRADGAAQGVGALVVFLLVLQNTTCFDLAGVFTVGNELRAIAQQGASRVQILRAAAPAMVVLALGAALLLVALSAIDAARLARRPRRVGAAMIAFAATVWVVTVAVPLAVLGSGLAGTGRTGEFFTLYGSGLARTVGLASISGGLAAAIAAGLALLWQDHRPALRAAAWLMAACWILAALVPATITATALEAAYNMPVALPGFGPRGDSAAGAGAALLDMTMADVIYRRPAILVLAHLSRFGLVAVLLGRWLAAAEPRRLAELRRLDGAETLGAWARSAWPRLLAASAAAALLTAVLAVSEVALTAQLQPPGLDLIATSILNDMHYQRPQTVMVAGLLFMGFAAAAALLVAAVWRLPALRRPLVGGAVALLALAGCSHDDGSIRPLEPRLVFGSGGLSPGQFNYPRGIAADAAHDRVYIVDKSARVQCFDLEGEPLSGWQMPEWELGKPTGLSVGPDGNVYVADTHYFRIMIYDGEGTLLRSFGSYGEGPGQFIYPTDVEFGPRGELYVAEYGGNDRVQVFTPGGELLFSFGSFGNGPDQLSRPQSLAFNADRSELFIADSCNHRIVVVDPRGEVLRSFGTAGRGPGQLMYPYDLAVLEDGTLLVCEFGNNRVQHFRPDGTPLGMLGGEGPRHGELRYPWGVDDIGDRVFVLDSGNNRVQVIRTP